MVTNMQEKVKKELIGNEGIVILDMVRRLNRRGAIGHLKRLIDKTHPADMAWVYRHLNEAERKAVSAILLKSEAAGEFMSELDSPLVTDLVKDRNNFV